MGCDIHLFVEKKEKDGWKFIKDIDTDIGRDYRLFSVLAGVRNTTKAIPISLPKGIPNDVSDAVHENIDQCSFLGDHSHSFLTLEEILNFNWDQKHVFNKIVNENEFKTFISKGIPNSWCSCVAGPNVRIVSNKRMKQIVSLEPLWGQLLFYTKVKWELSYKKSSPYFIEKFIPKLKALGEPHKIRIVFCFDN